MKKLIVPLIALAAVALARPQQAAATGSVWASPGSSSGKVKVGWSDRGGDCHVKYTEAGAQMYKYETVASCDAAMVEIGYLNPGVKYQFVVSNDNYHWSAPVYAVAASGSKHAQATVKKEERTPHEEIKGGNYHAQEYHFCSSQGTMSTSGALNHDERRTGKCGTGVTNLRTVSGKHSGEITVYWTPSEVSDGQYHLIYGTESGVYTMGALNIGGGSNSFTVRGLIPGERYYFKLVPVNQGQIQGYSVEVSDVAR